MIASIEENGTKSPYKIQSVITNIDLPDKLDVFGDAVWAVTTHKYIEEIISPDCQELNMIVTNHRRSTH